MSHARRTAIRNAAKRTPPTRARSPRRRPRRLAYRVSLSAVGLLAALLIWAFAARKFAPRANTNRQNFDAIIVLGTPADSDGNPTPELLDRVTEAVGEYERGMAPRIIVTGGAAYNRFVEADVMTRVAQAQGVPASVILEEPQARDTIQNACYSVRILKSHGWQSAEVVTSAYHLPRAAMIFSRIAQKDIIPLTWRVHAAPANPAPGYRGSIAEVVDTLKTARYLVWSRWAETCTP